MPQTEQFQEQFKWEVDHSQLIECLVGNGFVIVDSLLDPKLISNLFRTVSSRYEELKGNFLSSNPNSNFSSASIGICRKIVSEIERSSLFYDITHSESLLNCLEKFLGLDLAKTAPNALFINDPIDVHL